MFETKANQICEHNAGLTFTAPDGQSGTVEILDDMNCCCPTNNTLYAFNMPTSRKVMSAEEFIEFFDSLKPAA